MSRFDSAAAKATVVREHAVAQPPALVHSGWSRAFPWLVQGTTARGSGDAPFDLGLFSDASPRETAERAWQSLMAATGMPGAAHARQPHGARVAVHRRVAPGLTLVDDCDGHVTTEPGLLLGVTTADCVPVSVVDPERRAVAMIHAGWRGAAAGVLEEGLRALRDEAGSDAGALHVHLGPAICGACYEVGPEVFAALGEPVPERPTPIDLRAVLERRAVAAGVAAGRVTVSAHCTRCSDAGLFSHRGGDGERQVGYLGVRPSGAAADAGETRGASAT